MSILCLYFYVTPIQIQCSSLYIIRLCCLIFFSKYLFISLAALNVKFAWYLHSLSIHSLNFFFISGHLLHTPYNSNFFQEDLSYLDSTVFTRQNAHSNWGGQGGGGLILTLIGGVGGRVLILKPLAILAQGRVLGTVTNWCFVFFCS